MGNEKCFPSSDGIIQCIAISKCQIQGESEIGVGDLDPQTSRRFRTCEMLS